jgi:hypothetical protein
MRRRMTWTDNGEVARHRRASAHPATPHEGPASPAHKEDPAADAYQRKEGTPVEKAAALERKAAKCIRIATAMLGADASVPAIEDQALVLMDLTDRALKASLARLGGDEEMDADEAIDLDEATLAEEDLAEEPKKKSAMERRLARLERKLRRLQAASEDPGDEDTDESAMDHEEAASEDPGDEDTDESAMHAKKAKRGNWVPGKVTPDGWEPGREEAMLAEMLEEEGLAPASDDEALLAEMLAEEGMEEEEAASADPGDEDTDESAMDHMDEEIVEVVADPMGLMDAEMEEDEMMVLAKLFGGKTADEDDEDEDEKEDHDEGAIKDDEDHIEDLEEDKDEEEEDLKEEEASKKAARLRPQPKKASKGASRLGAVNKEAASEVNDLSQLWESAPDVSKFF